MDVIFEVDVGGRKKCFLFFVGVQNLIAKNSPSSIIVEKFSVKIQRRAVNDLSIIKVYEKKSQNKDIPKKKMSIMLFYICCILLIFFHLNYFILYKAYIYEENNNE